MIQPAAHGQLQRTQNELVESFLRGKEWKKKKRTMSHTRQKAWHAPAILCDTQLAHATTVCEAGCAARAQQPRASPKKYGEKAWKDIAAPSRTLRKLPQGIPFFSAPFFFAQRIGNQRKYSKKDAG
jgi:hypothetical protein